MLHLGDRCPLFQGQRRFAPGRAHVTGDARKRREDVFSFINTVNVGCVPMERIELLLARLGELLA